MEYRSFSSQCWNCEQSECQTALQQIAKNHAAIHLVEKPYFLNDRLPIE